MRREPIMSESASCEGPRPPRCHHHHDVPCSPTMRCRCQARRRGGGLSNWVRMAMARATGEEEGQHADEVLHADDLVVLV